MRPWTVVVLSDYGRDRNAYQNYDRLFDPALPPRSIPLKNRYILRMQATYALLDWLAACAEKNKGMKVNIWMTCAWPLNENDQWTPKGRRERNYLSSLLRGLLEDKQKRGQFRSWLCGALQIDNVGADALMWSPPRSLLCHVVPTLLRRLETNWRLVDEQLQEIPQGDYFLHNNPLPEFIPANLFSDLNLPEVAVILPQQTQEDEDSHTNSMAIYSAIREFAPGRITKRFAIQRGDQMYWTVPDNLTTEPKQAFELSEYCGQNFEYEGHVSYQQLGDSHASPEVVDVPLYRPYKLEPKQARSPYRDTSNAMPVWKSQIEISYLGEPVDVPRVAPWRRLFEYGLAYTHSMNNPVEVRRFSLGSMASISIEPNETSNILFQFFHNGKPASVGFAYDVDALCFRINLPDDLLGRVEQSPALLRALRVRFFEDVMLYEPTLNRYASFFQRQWLFLGYLSALTGIAIQNACLLEEARRRLHQRNDFENILERALRALFRFADEEDAALVADEPLVLAELKEILSVGEVQNILHKWASYLWQPPQEAWERWLKRCYTSTIASAFLESCRQMCPGVDMSGVFLDLDFYVAHDKHQPKEGQSEFWLTESSPGGSGIVEAILRCYREYPRQFFMHVAHALEATDFEIVDQGLTKTLGHIQTEKPLQDAFAFFRDGLKKSHEHLHEGLKQIQSELKRLGLPETHSFHAALQMRILRPASSTKTDHLAHELVQDWKRFEEELGIEIDTRVWAYMRSRREDLSEALNEVWQGTLGTNLSQPQQFSALYGLLWPRGYCIREQNLVVRNPYSRLPSIERLLVQPYFARSISVVQYTEGGWQDALSSCLGENSEVILRVSEEDWKSNDDFFEILARPIDQGYVLLYPEIQGIEEKGNDLKITFTIPMAVHR